MNTYTHNGQRLNISVTLVLLVIFTGAFAGEQTRFPLRENGTVPLWLVAGALPNRETGIHHDDGCLGFYRDFLTAYGGESTAIPAEGDPIDAETGTVTWERTFSDAEGLLDFNRIFNLTGAKSVVAYAFCRIISPYDRRVRLKLRSDDGIRAWLNENFIHEAHEPRGVDEAEDVLVVPLRKGENRLLLKVDQGDGGWGMGAVFEPLGGRPDLKLEETVELKDRLVPGLSDIRIRIMKPSMNIDGADRFPVEMQMFNTGVTDFSVVFSNAGWTSDQEVRYSNPMIGRMQEERFLDIPEEHTRGPVQVTILVPGTSDPLYTGVVESYPYGALYRSSPDILVIPSSHQDIAWMDSPRQCVEDRDNRIITPALELMRTYPDYHYDIEDALIIKEYLERHPEHREEIRRYCTEGRLLIGGTYTQPYESLNSGEALTRQLYFGRRWLKKELPGCDSRVASSPDVPGRTIQMPQLLKKAGIDYLLFSRFRPGFFRWKSPDGSGIVAYSMGHYYTGSQLIMKNAGNLDGYLADEQKFLEHLQPVYDASRLGPVVPVLASFDMSPPVNIRPLQKQFEKISGKLYTAEGVIRQAIKAPRYATSQQALDRLMETNPQLPVISGERPNVWLYIHGPTHHKAISSARKAAALLPAAEKFNVMYALLKNDMSVYPQTELNAGWEALVYPDHGWGGRNGEITDYVFYTKFEEARLAGNAHLYTALEGIAGMIGLPENRGKALVVFNDLSRIRSEIVTTDLTFAPGEADAFRLEDPEKNAVPFQDMSSVLYEDGSLRNICISFLAENMPSIGYRTFFIVPEKRHREVQNLEHTDNYENRFYRIRFAPGGIRQIYDKQLKRDLLNTSKFLGGEIFTMASLGNGAGEFSEVQQPTMDYFDKVSNYENSWKMISSGKVSVTYQLEQKLEHATIRQRVTLFHDRKQIDFDTEIIDWNGTKNREFRQAFPVDMPGAQVSYEVPFGQVRVGIDELEEPAGERYVQECSEVRPREVQNWISCRDQAMKVTLSSDVAVMDWIDPTDHPAGYPVLQPVLLASRRSCHGEGNWYLQEGNHSFHFSLFSGDANSGTEQLAVGVNHPLQVIQVSAAGTEEQNLPLKMSFVSCDNEDIVISTIKKCEDDDAIILRCYETGMKENKATVNFFRDLDSAAETNLIEEEGLPIPVDKGNLTMKLGPWAIETYKLGIR